MHKNKIELYKHTHAFNINKEYIEKRTLIVTTITFIAMFFEIFFGWITNSVALFADGWHMGTHAFALGISLMAYKLARKFINDSSFSFGTWKIEILGAYTSAIILGIVGLVMVYSSIERLIRPLSINYNQALFVAGLGLLVNISCAVILNGKSNSHTHEHHHDHGHKESHHAHDDLNFKSAYLHVIADALTSVFVIIALLGAKYFQLNWLDPFMGMVGAALIIHWASLLLYSTSQILLDRENNSELSKEISNIIESDDDTKISDLHLWKVADNKYACIVSIVASRIYETEEYRKRLIDVHELAHVTVEITKWKNAAK